MGRILYIAAAAAVVLAGMPPGQALAQSAIFLQAESYSASHDSMVNPPYAPIHASVVSGIPILRGLDFIGEWVSYNTPLTGFGEYAVLLRLWGANNVYYQLRIHVIPADGEPQSYNVGFWGKGLTCT